MPTNKPYRGEIHEWTRAYYDKSKYPDYGNTLGYCIKGIPKNHPRFIGWIVTSAVVDYDETTGNLETLNSTYKLVPPSLTTSPKK